MCVWHFFEWYFFSVVEWTHTHTPAPESIINKSQEFKELTEVSRIALIDIEFQASTEKRQSIRNPEVLQGILKLKTKFLRVKITLISSLMISFTAVDNPVMRDMKRIQSDRSKELSLTVRSEESLPELKTEVILSAVSLTVQS